MMRYVLIGNSTASLAALDGIRRVDGQGEVTIVGEEPHAAYGRPLISYLLEGKTSVERMVLRPTSFYEAMGARVLTGRRAASIDAEAHAVRLSGGETLRYDRLLVATGARPLIPPIKGLEGVRAWFTFTTLDDALALEQALSKDSRVLILGAGLIGLKCAEGVRAHANMITVVDRAPSILPSVLDAEAAARMRAHLEGRGITFRLGETVDRFEGQRAVLTGGEILAFDVLVLAVGVAPDASLVRAAGGAAERGILADEAGRTSLPDIYAAGDCVEGVDGVDGARRVIAVLPNAYRQGFAAGVAMAGGTPPASTGIAMNALHLLGMRALTAGLYEGEAVSSVTETAYKKLFVKEDRLMGFILLGDVERAGIYTALVRERTPLSSIDFPLIAEKPQMMAFSRAQRAKRMGGVPA